MEVIKSIDNLVGNSNELWKTVRTEGKVKTRTLGTEGLRHRISLERETSIAVEHQPRKSLNESNSGGYGTTRLDG